jgi:DHA2 family multidrug resistance protein-like MFS transporter
MAIDGTAGASDGTAGAGELASRREWIGLGVLSLPMLLLALDLSVLFLALPRISGQLHPSSPELLWIGDIYGFMIAGFLVTMGNLGDRIGHRRLLMIGAAVFGATSLVAAYSVNPVMLIIARAVLGIAGSTLMPNVLALVSNMFKNSKQRNLAISLVMSCFMVGMAIGPLVGGVLLTYFWWGSVFLLGLPVMVLILIVGPRLLPEHRNSQAGRLDPLSVFLSLAAILPFVYGIKELAASGVGWQPIVAIVVGLVCGTVFVRRQRRLPDPLLDLSLLNNRACSGALAMLLFSAITISGTCLLFIQYLQLVLGYSPMRSGLWLVPYTIGMIAGYMLAPALAQRMQPMYVMAGGMVVSIIGYGILTQVSGGLAMTVVGMVIAIGGLAPTVTLGIGIVLGGADPAKAGAASSLSQTSSELGVALGVAILGSIATVVYRARLVIPGQASHQAAVAAKSTLSQATQVAQHLPGAIGSALLGSARRAFDNGFDVVALVNAVIVVVLAVVAVALSRHTRAAEAAKAEDAQQAPEAVPAAARKG